MSDLGIDKIDVIIWTLAILATIIFFAIPHPNNWLIAVWGMLVAVSILRLPIFKRQRPK